MTPIGEVDYEGLHKLIDFQISGGIEGILAVGTTGESPTLDWNEHHKVTERIHEYVEKRCLTIAGTGSNSTQEALEGTAHAQTVGINCVLLVDPYYNGPSSMEIRKEYIEPIARKFPNVQVIPYIIPGRTGTQLLPQDLAIAHRHCPNVNTVKEATGDFDNMRLTRKLCGPDFNILSGDDDKTFVMMTSPDIAATGVISVMSNIAPRAVNEMTHHLLNGQIEKGRKIHEALQPLFSTVTVKTQEQTPFGPTTCKARNPIACKTLMNILGMPSGLCRQPIGKMTKNGLEIVLNNARKVYEDSPKILQPIEENFNVNLKDRLYKEEYWRGLSYA
jgi:4-hydroxy-tetrahydrodipicolinate synthase